MTIRNRANILPIVALPLSIAAAAIVPHQLTIVLLPTTFIALGVASTLLKCPRCGTSAYARRARLFGYEWVHHWAWAPRLCAGCELDFATTRTTDVVAPTPPRPVTWPRGKLAIALTACSGAALVGAILGWIGGERILAIVGFVLSSLFLVTAVVARSRTHKERI